MFISFVPLYFIPGEKDYLKASTGQDSFTATQKARVRLCLGCTLWGPSVCRALYPACMVAFASFRILRRSILIILFVEINLNLGS